jgi:hypothetical protein
MQEMSKKRRNHSPEFKSKVALAAIKGDQTLSELSRQYGINSNLNGNEQGASIFLNQKTVSNISMLHIGLDIF